MLNAALSNVNWSEFVAILRDDIDESQNENQDEEWPLVDAYSQAIADRVLIDASKLAAEAGFKYLAALTLSAWSESVMVPEEHDEAGRLWDVLNVLLPSIKGYPANRRSSKIRFTVSVRTGEVTSEDINRKSRRGPGYDAEPG